ncbi:LCP family protein [Ilumatobacter coccineus]|uniref:Putative LytR family regulatory protein n=1 Tax=Ilumatobacter coccineus (strain NBRC 103263 / KCTC 29153 / YM16-304) TaxID=1313172 RepID=A0A6C7EBQ2_ILUCY|nr:LCP family protein [Ilumatobacter coccineus]BAN03810.1 putative LytR family regulatory protein [Ilumatobacter coccineus YM16-304]
MARLKSSVDDTEPAPSSQPSKRSWGQRLLIVGVIFGALAAFGSAGAIWFVQQQLEDRNLVAIDDGSQSVTESADFGEFDLASDDGGEPAQEAAATESDEPPAPVETFPPAEPSARNILITGADNNSCISPDSPYYAAFGNRDGFGERSDTIMMWRINPSTSQVAVLSFPRDLWVSIDGRSSKGRINEAYERDDPQRLINTIFQNFGIHTDHYIQVDFCAFKTLVDAVDGVSVPFDLPVRDVNTGLNVLITEPSCFEFDGDHALAYVRSRKLQEFRDGQWRTDGASDLSRISRQQDFIRRVIDEAIDNAFSPSVIRGLLETSDEYVLTDTGLTVDKVLQYSGVLRSIDPATITTYQIQASGQNIGGASVLVPRISGDNMQAVLALFKGEATLASAPSAELDEVDPTLAPGTTVPLTTVPVTTQPDSAAPIIIEPETTTTVEAVPFETLPEVETENVVIGVVPDSQISCTN